MKKKVAVAGFVFVAIARPLWPETDEPAEELRRRFFELRCSSICDSGSQMPVRLLRETVEVFRGPEGNKTLQIGLALSLLALQQDKEIRRRVAESEAMGRHRDAVFEVGRLGGGRLGTFAAAGALYGIGALADRPRLKATGQQAAEALLITNFMVAGLKRAVQRERPDGSDQGAFPSGHSAGAFALASVIHRNHGMKVALPAYAFAGFVAYSRMNDDRHYLSDVLFGAAVGMAVGSTVARFHHDRMAVVPILGRRTRGVAVSFDF